MDIVGLRAWVTTTALLIFLFFYNKNFLKIKLRDLWCFFGTGICSILFFNFCYFKAMEFVSLSVAAVLLYTAPAIVMVLSYFLFGEKLTKRKVLALAMTFVGCVLVTGVLTDTGSIPVTGIWIGLGAGLGYALYSIFSRYALEKGYHSLTITFYTFLFTSIGSFILSDVKQVGFTVIQNTNALLLSLILGIFFTFIPYLTYTLGLRYVENGKASIFASVEPITATLVSVLMFRESLSLTGIIGIILVLVSLVICN